MKKFTLISFFFAISLLGSAIVYGQNNTEKSRLNIGQNNKNLSLPSNGTGALLLRNNIPSQLGSIPKLSYTQFYRDLLINSRIENSSTTQKTTSVSQESNIEKITTSEKLVVSSIYPNPANNYAQIEYKINGSFGSANLSFFNLIGKQVADFELSKTNDKVRINTANWENGIYGYSIILDGKVISTKKLLIVHN